MYGATRRLGHGNKSYLETVAHLRSVADMSPRRPHFKVGDTVRERFPVTSADSEIGIVIGSYELSGEYRCVVKCESGREAVFFENELISDKGQIKDVASSMTGGEEHIKPLDVARRKDFRLNEREEEHVRQCEECQRLL